LLRQRDEVRLGVTREDQAEVGQFSTSYHSTSSGIAAIDDDTLEEPSEAVKHFFD
jgi:hypothetical protein